MCRINLHERDAAMWRGDNKLLQHHRSAFRCIYTEGVMPAFDVYGIIDASIGKIVQFAAINS